MNKADFILVGVGGQGTLLASNILAEVGLRAGYDVKKSEVHGMAQRGGSVISHVRWGDKVYAPLLSRGEPDFLVAFEKLEALRYGDYLRPGGVALINDHDIPPISVTAGDDVYPTDEQVRQVLAAITDKVFFVPAVPLAEELGNPRVANVLILGVLSTFLDVPENLWLEVIAERVPEKYVSLNQEAFRVGRVQGKNSGLRESNGGLQENNSGLQENNG